MIGRNLATYLGGASALAIAAVVVLTPDEARAECTATQTVRGGVAVVDVVCTNVGPDSGPFATSFSDNLVQISDGDGADTLTMTGGAIVVGAPPPTVAGFLVPGTLDPRADVIDMLGGDDIVTISGGAIGAPASEISIDLGDGLNTFTMSGGTLYGSVLGGDDRDVIQVSGSAIINGEPGSATIDAGDGNNLIQIFNGSIGNGDPGAVATIFLGSGANTVEMSGGTVTGNIVGQGGGNIYTISGGTLQGAIFAGSGIDQATISGTAQITVTSGDAIGLDTGADRFTMTGGTITGDVSGNAGIDTFNVSGGSISGFLRGNEDADSITVSGGTIGNVLGDDEAGLNAGADTIVVSGGTITTNVRGNGGADSITIGAAGTTGPTIGGTVFGDDGDDTILVLSGSIAGLVSGGVGNDTINMSGGAVSQNLAGEDGNDQITVSGGTVAAVLGGTGNDTINMSGGTVGQNLAGGDGNDQITVSGGTVAAVLGGTGNDTIGVSGGAVSGSVSGEDGDDAIAISGGTVGAVDGAAGTDSITVSGGTISGNVSAETVTLSGGTIGGDITGISGNTLIINDGLSAAALDLRNGVVFSGTNAVGTITGTNLALGGAETQVFTGFSSVTADASQIGFGTSTIGIGALTLQNGSTLFINGTPTMSGNASVVGSTIQMIDGAADDTFTLAGITLNNATIGLDINQQTLQADQVRIGTFSALGTNTITVNLLGTPQFSEATDIPVIVSGQPVTGTFQITGLPGTPGSLFTYELVTGADGSLYLRATPADFEVALDTQNAIDVATIDTVIDALYGINNDAIATDLGLASGTPHAQLTDTVTVFASGQLAHMEHDGFDVSSGGISGAGPSFDVDEFSTAISLDFNAGKAFDFDPQYGLNLGLFGGYAQANVDVGAFQGFAETGDAENRSGMFGGYGLFRQNYNYLLVSGIAFFGSTDITNDILGTSGDYDTEGYGVTASAGHIFVLGERLRFDLRGGILGVTFRGGDYTDSGGTVYGTSRISFGAVKFEPGIYADFQLDNGMVISPYARADIQQRFGYSNEASIDGVEVDFDDADFSAAGYTGFNLKMTERTTLSSEIRGKWSADSTTLSGKLGLKIAF